MTRGVSISYQIWSKSVKRVGAVAAIWLLALASFQSPGTLSHRYGCKYTFGFDSALPGTGVRSVTRVAFHVLPYTCNLIIAMII